jgi:hypothetical protein
MSEETLEADLSQVDIKVRTQFLRDVFSRMARLLEIHFEGSLYVLYEQVDEVYIRLRRAFQGIVNTKGLEELQQAFPEELPESLYFVSTEDADADWEYSIQPALNIYRGRLLQFCVKVGAKQADSEAFKTLLEPADKLIDAFQQTKREETRKFWARADKQVEKIRAQFEEKTPSLPTMPDQDWGFVDNEKLRTLLARDYAELSELLKVQAPKSTLVMCGSILEAVLVSVLRKQENSAQGKFFELFLKKGDPDKKVPPLHEWGLHQLISVSAELGILDDDARRHANILKDYRNLIHPMVEFRRGANVDEDIVTALVALLKRILRLLSK